MIRTNLSTRPFYNERGVHLWMLAAAVLIVAATVFNVTSVLRYSRSDQRLAQQASRDEQRAADHRQQAAQLRASVDPRQVELASLAARQANELIDRRTFSWTELLNRLETTLPDDVHVVAIRPRIDKKEGILLSINVVAKQFEDTQQFVDRLLETGAFQKAGPVEDRTNDQGLLESTVQANYTPSTAKAPPAPAEKPKTGDAPPAEPQPEPAAPAPARGRGGRP